MKYCKITAGDRFLYITFKMDSGKKGKGLVSPKQAKKMISDLEAGLSQLNQPHQSGKAMTGQEKQLLKLRHRIEVIEAAVFNKEQFPGPI